MSIHVSLDDKNSKRLCKIFESADLNMVVETKDYSDLFGLTSSVEISVGPSRPAYRIQTSGIFADKNLGDTLDKAIKEHRTLRQATTSDKVLAVNNSSVVQGVATSMERACKNLLSKIQEAHGKHAIAVQDPIQKHVFKLFTYTNIGGEESLTKTGVSLEVAQTPPLVDVAEAYSR